MKSEKAISEIVGALILVALVITGLGIVGVIMFSVPPPIAKEKVVLSSSSLQCSNSTFVVVTRHEGGDTLDPKKLSFFLTTEFADKSLMNRFQVYPTSFVPAEEYSHMDKSMICNPTNNVTYPFNSATESMKNGDVIIIWYKMDETSQN